MKLDLRVDAVLAAGPERVWRALTDPIVLGRWLAPNDIDARAGNRFELSDPPVVCEVVEIEPLRSMTWSWNGGGLDEADTSVRFELRPDDACGTTRLRVCHVGEAPPMQRHALRALWTDRLDVLHDVVGPDYACRIALDAARADVYDALTTDVGLDIWLRETHDDTDDARELAAVRVVTGRRPVALQWSCTVRSDEHETSGTVVTFALACPGPRGCVLRVRHTGVVGTVVEDAWDRALARLAAAVSPTGPLAGVATGPAPT